MRRIGIIVAALLLIAAGCSDDGAEPRPDPEPAPEASATETPSDPAMTPAAPAGGRTIPVQLWFVDRDIKLMVHTVEVPATQTIGAEALERLIEGVPESLGDEKVFTVVPEDTELLGLTIDKGTARVDFSRAFENTGMGTAADGLQIGQVVYTLTQFPTVKRVEFLIEGEARDSIGGHGIELDGPQTRKDWESALPPVVVLTPYAGQELTPPFTISGLANVFEATVSYRIRDDSGKVIDKGFTTATCGTGCYGTFAQVIDLDVELPARIVVEVFESSAEDGSPLHMQQVPIDLVP